MEEIEKIYIPNKPKISDNLDNYEILSQLSSQVLIYLGDITQIKCDLIVNSSNSDMTGDYGLSKIIFQKCGKKLNKYLEKKYKTINMGSFVTSPSFGLPCKKILHAVGPNNQNKEMLRNLYMNMLNYMCNKKYNSIAFPNISTGKRGFSKDEASIIVLETIQEFLSDFHYIFDGKIIICCYDEENAKSYQKYLSYFFPKIKGPITIALNEKENTILKNLSEMETNIKKNFDPLEFNVEKYENTIPFIEKTIKQYKLTISPEYPPNIPENFKKIEFNNDFKLPENIKERIIGTLWGQAVGDAIGLATEFLTKSQSFFYYGYSHFSYNHYCIDLHRSKWMDKNFNCNDWTDDTDQMLLILDSLVYNNGNLNIKDIARRLNYWLNFGYTELGDIVACGVGANFSKVVDDKNFLEDPFSVSKSVWEQSNGKSAANGSVMRTSIVSVFFFYNTELLINSSRQICQLTHYDPRCCASTITINLIIAELLKNNEDIESIIKYSMDIAIKEMKDEEHIKDYNYYCSVKKIAELELEPKGIGYTFKPMGCAIFCLRLAKKMMEQNLKKNLIFIDLIEMITREGGDADTNCAVVGAVLGAYLKNDSIPEKWLKLRNIKWYNERINRVLKLYDISQI